VNALMVIDYVSWHAH